MRTSNAHRIMRLPTRRLPGSAPRASVRRLHAPVLTPEHVPRPPIALPGLAIESRHAHQSGTSSSQVLSTGGGYAHPASRATSKWRQDRTQTSTKLPRTLFLLATRPRSVAWRKSALNPIKRNHTGMPPPTRRLRLQLRYWLNPGQDREAADHIHCRQSNGFGVQLRATPHAGSARAGPQRSY